MTSSSKAMSAMTPRELLVLWTRMGIIANHVNAQVRRPAHGPRGLKRRAKAQRRQAHTRRLQSTTWRAYGEREKRSAS